MEITLDIILNWIAKNPEWSLLIIFSIAFLESIAIVGLFFPGSAMLATIGILIGTGTIPLWPALLLASLGGITGDISSYLIGRHYLDDIHHKWFFAKFKGFIINGEYFFHHHGKKSVFIARFIGPVRPIVPLIAGSLKMRFKSFIITDILSGIIWAPLYMLPGAFITYTGFSLHFNNKEIIYYGITIILSALISILVYKYFIKKVLLIIDRTFKKIANNNYQKINNSDNKYPESVSNIVGISFIGFMLFIITTVTTHHSNLILQINLATLSFVQNINLSYMFKYIVAYTLIAEPFVMVGLYIVILSYFILNYNLKLAILWFVNGAMSGGGAYVIKSVLNTQRPPGIALRDTSSYPSAHVTLMITLLGYLYFMIKNKNNSKFLGSCLLTAIITMMCSRVLLCAHWLTDIIGAIFFSMGCLAFNVAILQTVIIHQKTKQHLFIIALLAIAILWGIELFFDLNSSIQEYSGDIYENIAMQ